MFYIYILRRPFHYPDWNKHQQCKVLQNTYVFINQTYGLKKTKRI